MGIYNILSNDQEASCVADVQIKCIYIYGVVVGRINGGNVRA